MTKLLKPINYIWESKYFRIALSGEELKIVTSWKAWIRWLAVQCLSKNKNGNVRKQCQNTGGISSNTVWLSYAIHSPRRVDDRNSQRFRSHQTNSWKKKSQKSKAIQHTKQKEKILTASLDSNSVASEKAWRNVTKYWKIYFINRKTMAFQNSNWFISLYDLFREKLLTNMPFQYIKAGRAWIWKMWRKICICKRSFGIYESKKTLLHLSSSFKFWKFTENIRENSLNLVILFLDKILKTEYNHWQKTSHQRVSTIDYFKGIMRLARG